MVRYLKLLIFVPLGLIALAFAVGNRHDVTVSFDPFSNHDPSLEITMPLFLLLLLVLAVGVIMGSLTTWLTQGRSRRAARAARAETERLRAETSRLRTQTVSSTGTALAIPRPATYER